MTPINFQPTPIAFNPRFSTFLGISFWSGLANTYQLISPLFLNFFPFKQVVVVNKLDYTMPQHLLMTSFLLRKFQLFIMSALSIFS